MTAATAAFVQQAYAPGQTVKNLQAESGKPVKKDECDIKASGNTVKAIVIFAGPWDKKNYNASQRSKHFPMCCSSHKEWRESGMVFFTTTIP